MTIVLMSMCLILSACSTINVAGKTFRFDSAEVVWGSATDEDKTTLYEEFSVTNEDQLIEQLKLKNERSKRHTTFGTDGKYYTKNENNQILDQGFYKQENTVITLAPTEEKLKESTAFTMLSNNKGYVVTEIIEKDKLIFVKYQYVEQD